MGLPSGLGASFGWATETTYGTYVAPTKWTDISSNRIQKRKVTAQSVGLRGGTYVPLGAHRNVVGEDGGGPVVMDVPNKGLGILLQSLMGTASAPAQQGGTAAYLATFNLVDPTGKFFTGQGGVPDTTGTSRPYTYLGCKVIGAEFACQIGGPLTVSFDIDCRQVVENQTLAAPSYVTTAKFHFAQSVVKLGTYNSEASVQGVRGMTLRIQRPSAIDRFFHGNAGLKSEPLINDFAQISGTFDTELVDKTIFADRFAADTSTALDWVFTGPNIASTFFETFRIRVPQLFFDGETPTTQGPGITTTQHPWVATFDGTNSPAQILTISTDTTL